MSSNPHCDRYGDAGVANRRRSPSSELVNAMFEIRETLESAPGWIDAAEKARVGFAKLPTVSDDFAAQARYRQGKVDYEGPRCGDFGGVTQTGEPCRTKAEMRLIETWTNGTFTYTCKTDQRCHRHKDRKPEPLPRARGRVGARITIHSGIRLSRC